MEKRIYELRINPDENTEVQAIALVEFPAIEIDFYAFSKQKKICFSFNEEKQELLGPAMIPNQHITRLDDNGNEYVVFFSAETIRLIAQNYFNKSYQGNLNLDHTAVPAKSFVFQSYIVDSSQGILSPKGMDLPDGSWVVGVKVTDKDVWDKVKARELNGFSVEGYFEQIENFSKVKVDSDEKEILSILKEIKSKIFG